MKTIKKVTVTYKYGNIPDWDKMEQNVIYINKEYGFASHLCLCGCKEKVAMPLSEITIDGKILNLENNQMHWWKLYEKNEKISITPSVGNYNFPCKSHYIITNNVANFV